MFDMSWGEIIVIGGVALIVIGPKDLPKALRTVGQMTGKVRRMAGEFQSQFNEAMREADLDDVRRDVDALNKGVQSATATAFNPIQTIRDEIKGAVDRPVSPPTPVAPATPGELVPTPDLSAMTAEPTLALPPDPPSPVVDPLPELPPRTLPAAERLVANPVQPQGLA